MRGKIKEFVGRHGHKNYLVYTGTNQVDDPFYLGKNNTVPVPSVIWKLLLDHNKKGIAFVIVNHPDLKTGKLDIVDKC